MILFPLFLSWLGVILQEGLPQEVFRFSVEVRTVYVDVFAKRDGKPVTGLTAEDFEVYDNGIRQVCELLDHKAIPVTAMLLLDVSGSVIGERWDHLKAAAHAFVNSLDAKDEVGLLTFTREMQLRKELSSDFAALHRTLDEPMRRGRTSLYDSLYAGLKLLEARAGRPVVVLFTDGVDNRSWLSESDLLEVLKASEAVVYTVAVEPHHSLAVRSSGRSIQHQAELRPGEFLESITAVSGGQVRYLDPATSLEDIFLDIVTEIKSRYLLCYQPQGVPLEGWHTLDVKIKRGRADVVRSRPGYLARAASNGAAKE